uniref:Uncharacterized protein n=1 Tax=Anopheles atroparvus TaxID=41427 RepID=A0AAG5CU49_ANOAO
MSRGTLIVFWLMLASATCNNTNVLWEHRCEAGSAVFACTIPDFLYIPGQNSSRVIEPDSTVMRRLSIRGTRRRTAYINTILAYDAALHNQ